MNITVYLGANPGKDDKYKEGIWELGSWIAAGGHRLIYGGSAVGLMGILADAVLKGGGEVIGVEPDFFVVSIPVCFLLLFNRFRIAFGRYPSEARNFGGEFTGNNSVLRAFRFHQGDAGANAKNSIYSSRSNSISSGCPDSPSEDRNP